MLQLGVSCPGRDNPRTYGQARGLTVGVGGGYRSDAANPAHASAVNVSVPPSRFVVSRTITPWSEATSTQLPLVPLYLLLRQFRLPSSMFPPRS